MKEKHKIQFKTLVKKPEPFILVFLTLIFTAGLMFASVEMPGLLDKLLHRNVDFLDVATGQNEITDYKTELFLARYHIRLIGYICLALILTLIVSGFVLEKQGLTSAGAVILFLPVFGHFAATMFFLSGLAFLRFLWLPLILTGLGIFIFLMGVLAWMTTRIRKNNVADLWIYRISRHPQYLGWIIWSYGVLFPPGPNMKQYMAVPNTLPWLLTTMIITGVALLEGRKIFKVMQPGPWADLGRNRLFPCLSGD